MKDYDGNIIGAYWAGANASNADGKFSGVTATAIIIGVLGAVGIAAFIFVFCLKRVTNPLKNAEEYARRATGAGSSAGGSCSGSCVSFVFIVFSVCQEKQRRSGRCLSVALF